MTTGINHAGYGSFDFTVHNILPRVIKFISFLGKKKSHIKSTIITRLNKKEKQAPLNY